MLARLLALAAIWLLLSSIMTMLRGTRLHSGSSLRAGAWLLTVIVCGDLWALLTFGVPGDVVALSLLALGSGCDGYQAHPLGRQGAYEW